MQKGELIKTDVTGYAFEGKGIAKIGTGEKDVDGSEKKFVVFVNGSYPGDSVEAMIIKSKKSYAEARVEKILSPSPDRTAAECKYFGICGGCKQQDLKYTKQTEYKHEQVRDIFERIGGLENFEMLPIIAADKIYFYRNKMEYSFADKRWLTKDELGKEDIPDFNFALGLHIPRIFDKVLDIDGCKLQSELSNGILNFTRDFYKNRSILVYSTKNHTGFLRNLVIKQSHHTDDVMVNLVTSEVNERLFIEYQTDLLNKFPQITTVINNINEKKAQVATGDYEIVTHGDGFIYDLIGDKKFRISANSFFQTNTLQAQKLYDVILDFAEFTGNETVYDLYSGAGTIPIYISARVKYLYGFESVEAAIEDAKTNIEINGVKNFQPILADLNKSFLPAVKSGKLPRPDVIIADPPRSGMNPKTVADILELKPGKLVYVSCNPTTQARDVKLLTDSGYKLIKIRPVDMFPHTYHIENVALLILV